jgi:hypothetical protein
MVVIVKTMCFIVLCKDYVCGNFTIPSTYYLLSYIVLSMQMLILVYSLFCIYGLVHVCEGGGAMNSKCVHLHSKEKSNYAYI